MTFQSSGQISFENLNTERRYTTTATISLNDSVFRSLANIPSGPISLSSFYGIQYRIPITVTLAASTTYITGYTFTPSVMSEYVAAISDVILEIPSSTYVVPVSGYMGLVINGFATGDTVRLNNSGYILGYGGGGGGGGSSGGGGGGGGAGGLGLYVGTVGGTLTINNLGYIMGGGGGGGGTASYTTVVQTSCSTVCGTTTCTNTTYYYGGSGGGGGAGYYAGAGGGAGTWTTANGYAGAGGGTYTGGAASSGAGAGGSNGSAGVSAYGAGGAGGSAIAKNGNTVNIIAGNNSTQIKGIVS